MATSSFFEPLVIKDPEVIKRFIEDIESNKTCPFVWPVPKDTTPSFEEMEKEADEWAKAFFRCKD